MKISLIFFIFLATVHCDTLHPQQQQMIDTANMFMDMMNIPIFNINGVFQNRFDVSIATIWVFWRSASLFANSRGFITAGENRRELSDCLSSFGDLIDKVIAHLNVDVMKPIFDVRHTDTKIEDDLSTQFDEIRNFIYRATDMECLKRVPFSDFHIHFAYQNYSTFVARSFAEISFRTEIDYASRFYSDLFISIRYMLSLRSSIMTARTRTDYANFVRNFCKPSIFAKFEVLIDTSNNVINECAKRIYDALNEAIERLPTEIPFIEQLQKCV